MNSFQNALVIGDYHLWYECNRLHVLSLLTGVLELPLLASDGSVCYAFPDMIPDDVKQTVALYI